jgi:hypothetical protein
MAGGMADRQAKIPVVNYRKQKLERVLAQVNCVMFGLFDRLIFETVIDFCRDEFGYPNALPLRRFAQNVPVVPPSSFFYERADQPSPPEFPCPRCRALVRADTLTNHLAQCPADPVRPDLAIVCRYFDDAPSDGDDWLYAQTFP